MVTSRSSGILNLPCVKANLFPHVCATDSCASMHAGVSSAMCDTAIVFLQTCHREIIVQMRLLSEAILDPRGVFGLSDYFRREGV